LAAFLLSAMPLDDFVYLSFLRNALALCRRQKILPAYHFPAGFRLQFQARFLAMPLPVFAAASFSFIR